MSWLYVHNISERRFAESLTFWVSFSKFWGCFTLELWEIFKRNLYFSFQCNYCICICVYIAFLAMSVYLPLVICYDFYQIFRDLEFCAWFWVSSLSFFWLGQKKPDIKRQLLTIPGSKKENHIPRPQISLSTGWWSKLVGHRVYFFMAGQNGVGPGHSRCSRHRGPNTAQRVCPLCHGFSSLSFPNWRCLCRSGH